MQWTTSISEAVNRSRATQTPMLILLEPPTPNPPRPQTPTSTQLLQTLSTTSLHRNLFSNRLVHRLLTATRIIPLKIVAEQRNPDYESFQAFFQHSDLPELLLVNFDGAVLWRGAGYTSPRVFVAAVSALCGIDTDGWFGERERSAVLILPPTPSVNRKKDTPKPKEQPQTIAQLPKKGLSLTKRKCVLRVRLPTGATTTHEYPTETLFSVVITWLSEECRAPREKLVVSTHFPRYVFSPADEAKKLSELGLLPSANLVVAVCGEQQSDAPSGGDASGGWVYAGFARGRDMVAGFVGSFFRTPQPSVVGTGEEAGRERVPEREGGLDDEALRYNGNSTQFGYDDDR